MVGRVFLPQMDTSRRVVCQTSSGSWRRSAIRLISTLGGVSVFLVAAVSQTVTQSSSPPPTPPAWQQELDALRLLEGALSASPAKDDAEAASRDQRLMQLYHHLAEKYPARATVQKAEGDFSSRHEHIANALASFLRAQALEPDDADTADSIGSLELQLGRTREASEQFQRAVNARPDNAQSHYTLANVLFLFRHDIASLTGPNDADAVLVKSLAEFRRAAELAPGSLQYAQSYAETYYVLAHPDWEQARTAWKAVLALSAPSTDFANIHLARVSLRMNRPKEAESFLALVLDPKFALLRAKLHDQAARLPPAAETSSP